MTPREHVPHSNVELPLAELSSARLDGELYALGDSWRCIDDPDNLITRAGTLRLVAPERAVAERFSASWIYGLSPEPAQHQFCIDITARVHVAPQPRLQLREVDCAVEHTVQLGGLSVTTPVRTVTDLARYTPLQDPAAEKRLARMLAELFRCGGQPAEPNAQAAWDICARPGRPYRSLALTRLLPLMPPQYQAERRLEEAIRR
jgi:hypothetical protein